jgi:hypothetical protein
MKLLRVRLKGDESSETVENVRYITFEKQFLSVRTTTGYIYYPLRLIEKIILEDGEK